MGAGPAMRRLAVVTTTYVAINLVAAAANAFSGIAALARLPPIRQGMVRVGVPRSWLRFPIGTLKTAGAAGLLAGLAGVPYVGAAAAAAVGLVLFFVCAVHTHLLAADYSPQFGLAVGFLLPDVATLAVNLMTGADRSVRMTGRDRPRAYRTVLAGLWMLTAAAAAGGFGLLMSLVELSTTGRVTDPDGDPTWAPLLRQAGFAAAAALLSWAAVAWSRRGRPTCPRREVLRDHVVAPPAWLVRTAWIGVAGLIPYVVAKTVIAAGGSVAGVSSADFDDVPGLAGRLQDWGIDVTAVYALAGALLLLALTHRWGLAVPRWVLLTPGWVGAATLAPYGVILLVILPLLVTGVIDAGGTSLWWVLIGGGAFGPLGVALAVATVSYQHRTRPWCRCGPGPECHPVRGSGGDSRSSGKVFSS
jgi:hypothetical protein